MNAIALFSWLRVRLPGVIPIVCLTISVAHGSDGRDVVGADKRIARPIGTLSENPSDAELLRVDMFDQPLRVPSRPTTRKRRIARSRAHSGSTGGERCSSLGVDAVGSAGALPRESPGFRRGGRFLLVDLGRDAIERRATSPARSRLWAERGMNRKGLTDRNGMAIGDAAIGYLSCNSKRISGAKSDSRRFWPR